VIVLHQDKPEKLSSAVLEEYGVLLRQSLRSMFGLGATSYSLQTIFDASHRIVNARETQRFVILLVEVCTEYCEAVKRFATREALQPGPIVEEICKAFEQYTMHITNVERTFRCIDDSLTNCGEKPTEGLKVRALNVFRDVVIYQTEALFPTLDIQFGAGLEKSKSWPQLVALAQLLMSLPSSGGSPYIRCVEEPFVGMASRFFDDMCSFLVHGCHEALNACDAASRTSMWDLILEAVNIMKADELLADTLYAELRKTASARVTELGLSDGAIVEYVGKLMKLVKDVFLNPSCGSPAKVTQAFRHFLETFSNQLAPELPEKLSIYLCNYIRNGGKTRACETAGEILEFISNKDALEHALHQMLTTCLLEVVSVDVDALPKVEKALKRVNDRLKPHITVTLISKLLAM